MWLNFDQNKKKSIFLLNWSIFSCFRDHKEVGCWVTRIECIGNYSYSNIILVARHMWIQKKNMFRSSSKNYFGQKLRKWETKILKLEFLKTRFSKKSLSHGRCVYHMVLYNPKVRILMNCSNFKVWSLKPAFYAFYWFSHIFPIFWAIRLKKQYFKNSCISISKQLYVNMNAKFITFGLCSYVLNTFELFWFFLHIQ